ncbi:MAG TPA: alpha/beta hydrolase [Alphaproteobacteria bacterium]|nr:alpha/beta hydrolase [Alphaproteobacteria bacterium]
MQSFARAFLILASLAVLAAPASARGPRDVAYGPDPRHRLDLFLPASEAAARATGTPRKTLIFIHGGGWRRGTKDRYGFVGRSFSQAGYVVVLVNYRLYPQVRFPAFVDDAARAVAWVRTNVRRYGGDPDRIYLMGHSAGAHIAALLALDPHYLGAAGVPRTAIGGMIGLAGPYVFHPERVPRLAPIFAAHPRPNARPVAVTDNGGPPLLLLSAGLDMVVGRRNGPGLAAAYRRAGGRATARSYPAIGHGQIVIAISEFFQGLAPVVPDVVKFIGKP